ncbi:MAG: hypothetical protein GY822_28515 [Deltaproteobacteria bacterium]|nr:hypothetical protein [Deltaproteobacteria bacterium]
MTALFVLFASVSGAETTWAKTAGPGEVCEKDKDLPLPPKRVLVLNLLPQGDAEPSLATAFAEDMRLAISELNHAVLLSMEGALEAGAKETDVCSKSECLSEIGEATSVDFILYGNLFKEPLDEGLGWKVEVQLFDVEKGRPIDKLLAQSVEPALIGSSLRDGVPSFIPQPPKRKVIDCGPPALPERPVFILGSALTFLGTVLTVSSVAWTLDLNDKLTRTEVHRGLKTEALSTAPYAISAVVGSGILLVGGAAVMAAGVFILPDESVPGEGEASE